MANLKITIKATLRRFWEYLKNLPAEDFTRDFTIRSLTIVGGVILAVIWIFSILSFPPADFLVPLRYNSFLGVTDLGSWYELYLVPGLLILIYVLNIFLAHAAYKKDKMVAYLLLGSSLFVMICGAAVIVNLSRVLLR